MKVLECQLHVLLNAPLLLEYKQNVFIKKKDLLIWVRFLSLLIFIVSQHIIKHLVKTIYVCYQYCHSQSTYYQTSCQDNLRLLSILSIFLYKLNKMFWYRSTKMPAMTCIVFCQIYVTSYNFMLPVGYWRWYF